MARRGPQIKPEPEVVDTLTQESMTSETMAAGTVRPGYASSSRSGVSESNFHRSGAPSVETGFQQSSLEQTPMFLEMRMRQNGDSAGSGTDPNGSFPSFAHPGFTDIGQKVKACNDTLGNLQQLGIQHVAKLPELVLVGDQSAGKSSLMSALARIDLPRSGGVCTRCPIHIRLSSSNPGSANNNGSGSSPNWTCTVSLQQDYDYETPTRPIRKEQVTAQNPFPPWTRKPVRETKAFKTISDPAEIESVLRWAQIAVLNPNQNHELYIPGEGIVAKETELKDAASQTEAQFSPNIVALEMKGADLPDLSFYDLPGVFLSPDQESDEFLVKVVHNLTDQYIRREEAIIMWALPMNLDLENSISLGLIRRAKAIDRTIGVITKADMIQDSMKDQWLAVLEGKKQSVRHGFFLTSLPAHEKVVNLEGWEEQFFSSGTGAWPEEFRQYEARCGVKSLQQYITKQLGDSFARSLPTIKSKVHERAERVQLGLSRLPELPANVEHEVKSSLADFLRNVKRAVKDSSITSQWNTLNGQFQAAIFRIKPTCIVTEPKPQTIDLDSDSETMVTTPTKRPRASDSTVRTGSTSKRPRHDAFPAASTMVKREEAMSSPAPIPMRQQSMASTPAPDELSPFYKYFNIGRIGLDIRKIRAEIMAQKRAGMPNDFVPEGVYEKFSLQAVEKWELPLNTYIEETVKLLSNAVNQALSESLGVSMRNRRIFKMSQGHLAEFLGEQELERRAKLMDRFNDERYQMFTLNQESYDRFKARELEILSRARAVARLKAAAFIDWDYKCAPVEKLTAEQRQKEAKMINDNLPKLGEDPYKKEIEVAASVRGYYMTAATSFVESVLKEVNARLFRSFMHTQLDVYLDDKLGLMYPTPSTYQFLMEEDEKIAQKRLQLQRELEKLGRAMGSIKELENSFETEITRPVTQPSVLYEGSIHGMEIDDEGEA